MKHLKTILLSILAAFCVLGLFLCIRADRGYIRPLLPQLAWSRWETDLKPYGQATIILEERSSIPIDALPAVSTTVEAALRDAGVPAETNPWFYAASKKQMTELSCATGAADVELTEVAGDFFRVHPLSLRSGWYMEESDVMHDRIVLDWNTAWALFATDDVIGRYLSWNGEDYVVAAVVDEETGKYNEMAAGDTKRAWVFADSPASDNTVGFTCFEVVLPQPVRHFASATLLGAVKSYIPEDTPVIEAERRFGLASRLSALKNIPTWGISHLVLPYPYWENAARLTENHLALMLIPEAFFLLVLLILVIRCLVLLNRRRTWGLFSIREAIENMIDRKHIREYEKANRDRKESL